MGGRRILRIEGLKWCGMCESAKPLSQFYRRTASKDGLSYRCKDCADATGRQWVKSKPKEERGRIYHRRDIKRKFGITAEVYDALFLAQEGLCAICKSPNPTGSRLAVDHDHQTGKVRGLLCGPCNMLLCRIESDPDWANKAFSYLGKAAVENLLREGELLSR